MQVEKIIGSNIKKILRVEDELKNAFVKDIDTLITYVFDNYDVYKDGIIVEKDIVLKNIQKNFIDRNKTETKIDMCCAVTAQGTRCSKSSIINTSYCKLHRNHVYKELVNEIVYYDKFQ